MPQKIHRQHVVAMMREIARLQNPRNAIIEQSAVLRENLQHIVAKREPIMQVEALEYEIRQLPPQDRSRIFECLIACFEEDDQRNAAWAQEVLRRDSQADRDPSLLIAAGAVFAQMKSQLG